MDKDIINPDVRAVVGKNAEPILLSNDELHDPLPSQYFSEREFEV